MIKMTQEQENRLIEATLDLVRRKREKEKNHEDSKQQTLPDKKDFH